LTKRKTGTQVAPRSDLGSRRPTRRRKQGRTARSRQESTRASRVPRRLERLTKIDGVAVAPERVRPSYQPILRATIGLVEAGKAPTFVNIAKELGRSRQAVFQLFRRHPDLWAWIDRQVQAMDQHFVGSILYRHSMLAMQGMVSSAELVLKFHGGAYGTRKDGDDNPTGGINPITVQMNYLVPVPPMPASVQEQAAKRLPPPVTVDVTKVPAVSSR